MRTVASLVLLLALGLPVPATSTISATNRYAYGANIGWIGLSNAQAFVQTVRLDRGPDTDGDGIPDAWERERAGDLLTLRGGGHDADTDTATDVEEYGADTHPLNSADHHALLPRPSRRAARTLIASESRKGSRRMKISWLVAAGLLAGGISVPAADVVIQSFDRGGTLTFNEATNLMATRVEWASSPGGAWTNFAAASARLDHIPATGSGIVTAAVPLWYRMVATVTNPPPVPRRMMLIPPGAFKMGNATNVFPADEGNANELPQHTVYVSAFYMENFEVTWALWREVATWAATNGYDVLPWTPPTKATNYPLNNVGWYGAVKWCNARSEIDGLTPVYYTDAAFSSVYRTGEVEPYANWAASGYRLPTEAEWEKAARGGAADHRFPWSDTDTIQHARANYYSSATYAYDTSATRGFHPTYSTGGMPYTSPVGSFAPNDYGLYDMAGNVWEWCWDSYGDAYYASSPSSDPKGPDARPGGDRVVRSGTYYNEAIDVRCTLRTGDEACCGSFDCGFRCARSLTIPAGMALIPPGSFMMGACTNVGQEYYDDEVPQHPVYVSAFFLDVYEVTKAQWDEVKAYNGGSGYVYSTVGDGKATNHPVQAVSWYDAVKWCNARSERDGLTPVYYADAACSNVYRTGDFAPYANWAASGYRLPTEAEWEKAARGGVAGHRFPWSDVDTIQHARANYYSHTGFSYDTSATRGYHPAFVLGEYPFTSPVGSFPPNDYGLYDMAGNVSEWCWDWYEQYYYAGSPASNPRGPDVSLRNFRARRSGSWNNYAAAARCAFRSYWFPDQGYDWAGFRCARGLEDEWCGGTRTSAEAGMKTAGWPKGPALARSLATSTDEVVIPSADSGGTLTFSEIVHATAYRVEWASTPDSAWTNFAAASARLDTIPPTGIGLATAYVPLCYRVVATVTNPPGMVLIPAGTFTMGACTNAGEDYYWWYELPQHAVSVSPFYMDRYEVTKALWDEVKAFNGGNGYSYANAGGGKDTDHPAHTVNWYDAVKWCNARSEKAGLTPVYYTDAGLSNVYRTGEFAPCPRWEANGYRLPTEAEWEKAARGGIASHRFAWSDTDAIDHARANYNSTHVFSWDVSPTGGFHPAYTNGAQPYTSPAGAFPPNDSGLYDMTGNVWEWCWDWYDPSYYASSPGSDPKGPDSSPIGYRVLRSGSWLNGPEVARCAFRGRNAPADQSNTVGFRCARGL